MRVGPTCFANTILRSSISMLSISNHFHMLAQPCCCLLHTQNLKTYNMLFCLSLSWEIDQGENPSPLLTAFDKLKQFLVLVLHVCSYYSYNE